MWTVVYMSQDKANVDGILAILNDNKILNMLRCNSEDDFGSGTLYEILVPSTELEAAQDLIFDFEVQN